jgi:hypothetical protein
VERAQLSSASAVPSPFINFEVVTSQPAACVYHSTKRGGRPRGARTLCGCYCFYAREIDWWTGDFQLKERSLMFCDFKVSNLIRRNLAKWNKRSSAARAQYLVLLLILKLSPASRLPACTIDEARPKAEAREGCYCFCAREIHCIWLENWSIFNSRNVLSCFVLGRNVIDDWLIFLSTQCDCRCMIDWVIAIVESNLIRRNLAKWNKRSSAARAQYLVLLLILKLSLPACVYHIVLNLCSRNPLCLIDFQLMIKERSLTFCFGFDFKK